MSYGTLVSQRASARVVRLEQGASRPRGVSEVAAGLEAARGGWPPAGAHGRLGVTTLGLTFTPSNPAHGGVLRLALREIRSVELTEGRWQRFIGLRTADHLIWVRTTQPREVAQVIATHAHRARSTATAERHQRRGRQVG